VTGPGTNTISDLRQILDLAWARHIGLLLSIWSFDMTGTAYGSDLAARNQMLLTDNSARAAYLQKCLLPMVDSLKGHPGILAWEVFNEAEGMSNEFGWSGYLPVSMNNIQIFVNQAAGIIHRADPSAKVTTATLSFGQLADVSSDNTPDAVQRVPAMTPEEKSLIETEFADRYGFSQPAERILASTAAASGYNYYRNDRLIAAGGDADGTLDFYEVHYYSWQGTTGSPFHNAYKHWGLTKPLIVGEFYAQPTFGLATEVLYRILIDSGYAGAYTWQWINSTQQSRTKSLMQDLATNYPSEITVDQTPGTIFFMRSTAAQIQVGQSCTISWSTAQGSSVTLNGTPVSSDGDTVVTPIAATAYVLKAIGSVTTTRTISVNVGVAAVGDPNDNLPAQYSLDQNYPNPFNPVTVISYSLPERASVQLSVYDILGREIAALVRKEQPAGVYAVKWDAANFSSGVYYYRIQAGGFSEIKKLLLTR
jgi:hypothetical protein